MSNIGIHVGYGSISGCSFFAGADDTCGNGIATTAEAIYGFGYRSTVVSCSFFDVDVTYFQPLSLSFNKNSLLRSNLFLDDTTQTVISGNVFEGSDAFGNPKPSQIFLKSCFVYNINDNVFFENAQIVYAWDEWQTEGVINGNQFASSNGIVMDGAPGVSQWANIYALTISENQMTNIWNGGDMRIELGGGDDSNVGPLIISNNTISAGGDAAPIVNVTSSNQNAGTLVKVVGNMITCSGVRADMWAVKVHGGSPETVASPADYDESSVVVENNIIYGSQGIFVDDTSTVLIADNWMPQAQGTNTFYANLSAGQIRVKDVREATVLNNYLSVGNQNTTFAEKAAVYVKARAGKVSGNTIQGVDTAGVDTAITVDGPLFVSDNHYLGIGQRWGLTGSPYTNEIVVEGTGAKISVNSMDVDVSNATTPLFLDMSETFFSMRGVLSVTSGTMRLPFRQDVEIVSISAMVGTQPAGASIIVDVNKAGVTLFTTQGNRPTIAASSSDSGLEVPDVTFVAADDYLTVDVDQVGSSVAGADLSVLIRWRLA